MSVYENDLFRLEYYELDPNKEMIINILNIKIKELMQFFNIDKLDKKIEVKIYYSIEEYKNFLKPFLKDGKYYDWMIGSAHGGKISKLSFECCKLKESHKNMTLEEYLNGLVHEIVHKLHQLLRNNNLSHNTWFSEALATNLSNQNFKITPITCTVSDLRNNFNDIPRAYSIVYTLGKFVLQNYSHDLILKMCENDKILDEYIPEIFEGAAIYVSSYLEIIKNKEK